MSRKSMLSIVSLLALAVICVYVSAANAFPAPQGIPVPQELINELPSMLMEGMNNPNKNLPSFEELKQIYIERDHGQRLTGQEMSMIEAFSQQNPNDPNAWILLGKAKWAVTSRPDTPEQCFLRASQLGSEEGTILFHYAILRDINRSTPDAFNALYDLAQKGSAHAAFLVAETLTHGADYFPPVTDIPDEQRFGVAATFYEMVINANFVDWGQNCSDIAKQRMMEIRSRFPQIQLNHQTSVAPSQSSTASSASSQNVQTPTSDSPRTIDDKYLSDEQKQSLKEAYDEVDDVAVKALYVGDVIRLKSKIEDDLERYFYNSSIPSYTHLLQCATILDDLSKQLVDYVINGIDNKKAQNQSYFKDFYQQFVNSKSFDWIEDANKRKRAYGELQGACNFLAKSAPDYYQFDKVSEDKLKNSVLNCDFYGNGNKVVKALNNTLSKIRWSYSNGAIAYEYHGNGQGKFTSYRYVYVSGYHENNRGKLEQVTFRFKVYKNAGDTNLGCISADDYVPTWFAHELR